jgi:hypothetical protein
MSIDANSSRSMLWAGSGIFFTVVTTPSKEPDNIYISFVENNYLDDDCSSFITYFLINVIINADKLITDELKFYF